MNGLNYAQFLESILRIAYSKLDNSAEKGAEDGFANQLETMFGDADLDIKKKAKSDETLQMMLQLAEAGHYRENYQLLAAIFSEKAMPNKEEAGMIDMSRDDFVQIMKESQILIKKEEETKKSEAKAKPAQAAEEEEGQKAPAVKYDEYDVIDAT